MTHPPLEQFEAWVEGALAPADCERFEAHLASCAPCAAVLRREARVTLSLQQAARLPRRVPRPLAVLGAMAALALALLVGRGSGLAPVKRPEPSRPRAIEAAVRPLSSAPRLAGLGLPPRYEQLSGLEAL